MNANSCIFCCGFRLDASLVHLPGGWRKYKCNKKLPVRKVINVTAMLGCDVRASGGGHQVLYQMRHLAGLLRVHARTLKSL